MNDGLCLESLPCLTRLAFAVRCVRRVQVLLGLSSASVSEDFLEAVDRAVALAEQSSVLGRPCVGLAEAAEEAERRARGAVGVARACDAVPNGGSMCVPAPVRRAVAYAAAAAAHAALEHSAHAASRAVAYAEEAVRAADARDVGAAMAGDLEKVREAVQREGWNDEKGVAPGFFAPL